MPILAINTLYQYLDLTAIAIRKLIKIIILSDNGEFSDGFVNDGFRSRTIMSSAPCALYVDFYLQTLKHQ